MERSKPARKPVDSKTQARMAARNERIKERDTAAKKESDRQLEQRRKMAEARRAERKAAPVDTKREERLAARNERIKQREEAARTTAAREKEQRQKMAEARRTKAKGEAPKLAGRYRNLAG